MPTTLKLVQIGNSKGVRLPAGLIRRYNLSKQIRLTETPSGILLERGGNTGMLSLKDSFTAMSHDKKSHADALSWAESGLSDGLQDEEFKGWLR